METILVNAHVHTLTQACIDVHLCLRTHAHMRHMHVPKHTLAHKKLLKKYFPNYFNFDNMNTDLVDKTTAVIKKNA